jgi:hypothetical protein
LKGGIFCYILLGERDYLLELGGKSDRKLCAGIGGNMNELEERDYLFQLEVKSGNRGKIC